MYVIHIQGVHHTPLLIQELMWPRDQEGADMGFSELWCWYSGMLVKQVYQHYSSISSTTVDCGTQPLDPGGISPKTEPGTCDALPLWSLPKKVGHSPEPGLLKDLDLTMN